MTKADEAHRWLKEQAQAFEEAWLEYQRDYYLAMDMIALAKKKYEERLRELESRPSP